MSERTPLGVQIVAAPASALVAEGTVHRGAGLSEPARPGLAHVVLDNYIIHKALCVRDKLELPGGRVVLHFLPPYSPQDNLIEGLWKQLHDHVSRNHQHRIFSTLVNDVRKFLDRVQPFPGTQISTLRMTL